MKKVYKLKDGYLDMASIGNSEEKLNEFLYFNSGETFRINEWYGCGFVSQDKKYINFTIPLPRSTKKTNGYSISNGNITIGLPDGTALISRNITELELANYYREFYLTIRLYNQTNWSPPANSPLSIKLDNLDVKFQ